MLSKKRLGASLSFAGLFYMGAVDAPPAFAETPGKDGDASITGTGTVINEYGAVVGAATSGSTSVTLANRAANMPSLEAGDLVMLYQARGASIVGADSSNYGEVTALNSAGRYEFQTVASVSGNTVTFETYGGSCGGLEFSYDTARAQLIRVPQYRDLTVAQAASVVALTWDGRRGGVVVADVSGTATINGAINVSGQGFRGGLSDNVGGPARGNSPFVFVSNSSLDGAPKGEGIAGQTTYNESTVAVFGRGAAANGGGGGNNHNAGGGGGANGGLLVGWNGLGNPSLADPSWAQAWNIDGSLTAATLSSGGGRGGYSYFTRDQDALTAAPGNTRSVTRWGNDQRREQGGRGGRPVPFDRTGRLFLGGGGGAGDGNNRGSLLTSSNGGDGGGLVFLTAQTLTGSGLIRADGLTGQNSRIDGAGGGGAGGTVVLRADLLSSLRVSAAGGAGGSQLMPSDRLEGEGPGGGGGGGVVAVAGGLLTQTIVTGGANGISTAPQISEFTPNGATFGALGEGDRIAPSREETPFCYNPTAGDGRIEGGKTAALSGDGYFTPGADVVYTLDFSNVGSGPVGADSITIVDPLPPEVEFFNDEFEAGGPVTGPVAFTGSDSGLLCCNSGEVDYSDTTSGPPVFGYTPQPGYDPAVTHIRVRPRGSFAPGETFELRFRTRIK